MLIEGSAHSEEEKLCWLIRAEVVFKHFFVEGQDVGEDLRVGLYTIT